MRVARHAQDGPRRTCIGCRTVRPQAQLIRLAATADGGVAITTAATAGRGAYLCPALDCLERILKRRGLPQALRRPLPRLDIQALRQCFASAVVECGGEGRGADRGTASLASGEGAV